MANYTISQIKKLREATGAGMIDVKKALEESSGNFEKAIEIIRIKGLKKINKRESNRTSEGLVKTKIVNNQAVMIEVLCETDFVSKSSRFIEFTDKVIELAIKSNVKNIKDLLDLEEIKNLVIEVSASLGERIDIRRLKVMEGSYIYDYLHRTSKDLPPQIGVLFHTINNAEKIGHDIAVHIAACAPKYLNRDKVPSDILEKERNIVKKIAKNEGKPDSILEKIINGRLISFYKECVLLDQPFAKDTKRSVEAMLQEYQVKALEFTRFRVGEELE